MGKAVRNIVAAFATVLLFATVGCATAPPRSAMVPFSEATGYGYSEEQLAPDLYEVRYISPRVRLPSDDMQSEAIEAQKQRAYDFALWRAAQLALKERYPTFTIEQESRDAIIAVRREPAYPSFWPPYRYYDRFDYLYSGSLFDDPYWYDYRTCIAVQVTAALRVRMHKEPEEGSLDAAATAARLEEAYREAVYPASSGC